jgi:inorganic pyrophosphatase/exopolyphosphatase
MTMLAFLAGGVFADDAKTSKDKPEKDKNARKATVTKVDAKKGTVTLKMKGKDGKDHETTFTLTEDVRMWDDKGNVAVIDVFRSGDEILVVEREGKLKAMQKGKKGDRSGTSTGTNKKPGG